MWGAIGYIAKFNKFALNCIIGIVVASMAAELERYWGWRVFFLEILNSNLEFGIVLGLLALTGVLWGCTNPFIRQGTKGLRDVTATTWLGQAWAEVTFLLGNWKYVLPWLVNQGGSLSYLAAVQRAPLSVAVPTANSLAFVCTALTGATIGAEEPLDARSIVGIVLIMLGTGLCCFNEAS